jgi:hypothetical protein
MALFAMTVVEKAAAADAAINWRRFMNQIPR